MSKYEMRLIIVGAALVLASCSSNSENESNLSSSHSVVMADSSADNLLVDSDWLLISTSTSDEQQMPALVFPPYEMSFQHYEFGSFSLSFSTCGGLEGESEIVGSTLTTTQVIDISSEADCVGISSDNVDTNSILKDIFQNTQTTFDKDGGLLSIRDDQNRSAVFVSPIAHIDTGLDDMLSANAWQLVSAYTLEGKTLYVDDALKLSPPFTIGFIKTENSLGETQRFIGGKALCGAYTANYALEANVLTSSSLIVSIECEFAEEEIPSVYKRVLFDDTSSLIVEATLDGLILTSDANERLVFKKI